MVGGERVHQRFKKKTYCSVSLRRSDFTAGGVCGAAPILHPRREAAAVSAGGAANRSVEGHRQPQGGGTLPVCARSPTTGGGFMDIDGGVMDTGGGFMDTEGGFMDTGGGFMDTGSGFKDTGAHEQQPG